MQAMRASRLHHSCAALDEIARNVFHALREVDWFL